MDIIGVLKEANANYKCGVCGYSVFGYSGLHEKNDEIYCKYCGRYIRELKVITYPSGEHELYYAKVGVKNAVY